MVLFIKLRLVKPRSISFCLQHVPFISILAAIYLWGSCCEFLGEILTAVGILLLVLHCHLEFNLWGSFTLVGELYPFFCVFGIIVLPVLIRALAIRCAWHNFFHFDCFGVMCFGLITVRPTPLHSFAFQFGWMDISSFTLHSDSVLVPFSFSFIDYSFFALETASSMGECWDVCLLFVWKCLLYSV